MTEEELSHFLVRHGLRAASGARRPVSVEVARDIIEQVEIEMSLRRRRQEHLGVQVSALTAGHLRALLT